MARFVCPNCEYVYDEATGDPREGWPAGTPFAEVDPDWTCPDCGVREQVDFVPEDEFTHNDQDGDIISAETRAARARADQAEQGAQQ
jgi:rubredoxin